MTSHRAFTLVRMLLQIFLNNGDDFLVGDNAESIGRSVRMKGLTCAYHGSFRLFLAESDIIVPSIQNPTDISDSLIALKLQPMIAGDGKRVSA
jgi:hypothetical protein